MPALIAAIAGPEQTRRERNLLDQWVKIYSRFNEVLSGIMTVKSFTREHDEKQQTRGPDVEGSKQAIGHEADDTTLDGLAREEAVV